MQSFKKGISLILGLILLLPLSACLNQKSTTPYLKNVVIKTVEEGTIANELQLTGVLEATTSANVSTKSSGRIKELYKDVGDSVEINELLGKLGGEENKVNLQTVKTTIQNLEKTRENIKMITEQQIINSKQEFQNASKNLELINLTAENFEKTSVEDLKNAQLYVEQAELNLQSVRKMFADTKTQLNQKRNNLFDNAESAITQSLILSKKTESLLDDLLGVSQTKEHQNDEFESMLGNLDRTTFSQAIISLRQAIQLNQELQEFYDTKVNIPSPLEEDLLTGLTLAQEALTQNKTASEDVFTMLENTTSTATFTQTTLDSYKNQITALGSQIENLNLSVSGSFVTGVTGVLQGEENLDIQTSMNLNQVKTQVEQAEKTFQIAKQNLTKLEANLKLQKEDIEVKKEIAKTKLEQAKLGVETAETNQKNQLQILQTQLDQAKDQLNLATVSLENTEIRAPFRGIITEKLTEVGTVVQGGTPIFKVETPNTLKVKVQVPEAEIQFIKIGQKAWLESMAFEGVFEGIVNKITPKVNTLTHKIEIEILVNNLDNKLIIGSLVHLKMLKEQKTNVLIIPKNVIINLYGEKFVFVVLADNTVARVLVEEGVRSENEVEIVKGLKKGDKIVVKGQNNLRSGDKVKIVN